MLFSVHARTLLICLLSQVAFGIACLPGLPGACSLECTALTAGFASSSTGPGAIVVTPTTGLTTTEAGATAAFTIAVNRQPTGSVTIPLSSDDVGEGSVAPASLTITAASWTTPQTVTVTGVDDGLLDGPQLFSIIVGLAESTDPGFDGIDPDDVSLSNQDDDTPGVLLTQTGGSAAATEGGATDSYTIVLTSQPTANVTVAVSPNAQVTANGSAIPIDLIFTAGACPGTGDWCTPQTVNVAAVDDALAESVHIGTITHSATSADADYNGIPVANINTNITDDDVASVSITESGGSTAGSEAGASDSYTLVLTSQPLADVTISVTPDAQLRANGSTTASNLSFTAGACPGPGDWCTAQTVTVSIVDDAVVEGAHAGTLSHTATSADATYNGLGIAAVTAAITDNDRFTFRTAAVHDGDFDNDPGLGGNGDGSGVAEADQFCMNDVNRPSADLYKAMLVKSPLGGGPERRASQNPNAGDGQIDWVLAPNTNYYRADGTTPVFTTNATGIFVFGAAMNSFAATPGDFWTGLTPDWRVTPPMQSCGGWSTNGGVQGRTGQSTAVNTDAISQASTPCATAAHLICVQQ